ncbi:hypothetical protein BDW71DRAFT_183139 [Aspergillus fruticulosus]
MKCIHMTRKCCCTQSVKLKWCRSLLVSIPIFVLFQTWTIYRIVTLRVREQHLSSSSLATL